MISLQVFCFCFCENTLCFIRNLFSVHFILNPSWHFCSAPRRQTESRSVWFLLRKSSLRKVSARDTKWQNITSYNKAGVTWPLSPPSHTHTVTAAMPLNDSDCTVWLTAHCSYSNCKTPHAHTNRNTQTHSITLPVLFPECPLSLGSFDCIDCNEFSVHTMMTIMILLLLLLLLQPLFSLSAHLERTLIIIYFSPFE